MGTRGCSSWSEYNAEINYNLDAHVHGPTIHEYMISIDENTNLLIKWQVFLEKLTVLLQITRTGARIVLRLGLLLWWI